MVLPYSDGGCFKIYIFVLEMSLNFSILKDGKIYWPSLEADTLRVDRLKCVCLCLCRLVAMTTRPTCLGPEPMCANYCPNGYRYKDDGCMTCDCNPVEPVETRASATRTRPRCRGAQPMCANACPGGYKYKPDGCMTCECAQELCVCYCTFSVGFYYSKKSFFL